MKTNHYKQQSIKLLGLITLVCFSLFLSSCGTENDESFEMPSEEVLERVAAATEVAGKYFSECNSITELKQHLDEIWSTEGIVDVWTDDLAMYVEIDGWGVIDYYYPPVPKADDISVTRSVEKSNLNTSNTIVESPTTRAGANNEYTKTHYRLNDLDRHSFVIYNALFTDMTFKEQTDIAIELQAQFQAFGFKADLIQNTSNRCVDFFSNEISKYDIVYILAHGGYDEEYSRHRIVTNEMIWEGESLPESVIEDFIYRKRYEKYFRERSIPEGLNEDQKEVMRRQREADREMTISCIREKDANGNKLPKYYVSIYEKFLESNMSQFDNKSIVFSASCKSMEGKYTLGDIYCQKGAACYLGYNNNNIIGPYAVKDYLNGLLNGLSAQSSYDNLDDSNKEDIIYGSTLIFHSKGNSESNMHVCITHPDLVSYEESSDGNILLSGSIKIADPNVDNKYAFALGKSDSKEKVLFYNKMKKYWVNKYTYNNKTKMFTFELPIDATEFYSYDNVCACLIDGDRICYGDEKKISKIQAYAEYDSGTKTLTFRHGEKPDGNNVFDANPFNSYTCYCRSEAEKVVFDESFAIVHLNSFSLEEFTSLKEIVGLQHLNTSNMTSMEGMFARCHSLTSLDLSSFDTSNVTNMSGMFIGCHSLTSFDLTSFDTSNVTTMEGMFGDCSSLTSLDLCSFATSNVKEMYDMFGGCSKLVTIYVSEKWTTVNIKKNGPYYGKEYQPVSGPTPMFEGCENLVGGKGTKYSYHSGWYECWGYANIDHGEDDPGYFTYKKSPN